MRMHAAWGAAAVAAAMMLPPALEAQVQTLKDHHVADVESLRSKFVALAEAFPEDRYDWRPMEGTRSVREVLVLVAAEANVFPANWGLPPAKGSAQGYQAESARVGGVAGTRALLVAELGRSFDHLSRSLAGMSDAARAADGRTFGRDIKVDAGITLIFVPDVADLAAFPSDPAGGGPYVMWRGTPYAHIMMPVAAREVE